MIKGCQRRMIVVQGKDKSVFETAYFVLRREREHVTARETDMLAEADRIINESRLHGERSDGRIVRRLKSFFLVLGGCCMGCGVTLLWQAIIR